MTWRPIYALALAAFAIAFAISIRYANAFTSTNKIENVKITEPAQLVPEAVAKTVDVVVAAHSACTKTYWADRGRAIIGFYKGMATAYHVAVCENSETLPLGTSEQDALKVYGLPATRLNTYNFMLGLAVRESSGKYWEGRDESPSAKFTKAEEVESGLLQFSQNSSYFFTLYKMAQPKPTNCLTDIFKEGGKPVATKNFGTGPGLQFQKDMKACPRYATQWGEKLIRRGRKHNGPIGRMEVQFNLDCLRMLKEVEEVPCK